MELLTDITEDEANDVVGVLVDAGIDARKAPGKEGMVSVNIDQAQISKAISLLHFEGLPRERFAKMGEVFRKEGLISSPLEERARYLWALSQELSSTISQIDGVLKARVHVVLPERSTGSDPAMPSSAAVFIKHRRQLALDEIIPQIKRLVSNSIPGLTAEKVSVVMVPATPIKRNAELGHASGTAATVWGIELSSASAASLRGLLTGMLVLLLSAIGVVGLLAWKLWGSGMKLNWPLLPSRKRRHTSGEG
ncbi:type III secretion inner membrane ring lipoprotein SctJ [Noviherbaspirillum sp. DKR-6]|uniref:Lipoprotein n=1 Tax=Noviherbaspirillum pedocola TaxID=2801341 RepID=A0A934SPR3_9BURK|nr:type III secretion inner membrane ring lipoprotein SctJ [Noviherbaspirillum pedocola]